MKFFDKIKQSVQSLLSHSHVSIETPVVEKDAAKNADKNVQHMHWHVDTMMMAKFWGVGLAIVAVAYFIFQSLSALYLILGAYIISIALESVILFFMRRGLPRPLSIGLSYFVVVSIFLSGFVLLVPFVFAQIAVMIDTLIASIKSFQSNLQSLGLEVFITDISWLPGYAKDYLLDLVSDPAFASTIQSDIQRNMSQLIGLGTSYAQNIGSMAVGIVTGFFSLFAQFMLVITLAIFFSVEKKIVMRFVAGLWGKQDYDFVYAKLDRIYKRLGLWLRGQTIVCLCVGLAVFIVLNILSWFGFSMPNIGSLAIIAGVTNFIPYLGPFLGGVPAILLAIVHFGRWGVLVVFIAYAIIQQLESSFLVPYIMNKTVGISPLLILICLLLGGFVMGFVGVILAVPIAVIISMIYGKE